MFNVQVQEEGPHPETAQSEARRDQEHRGAERVLETRAAGPRHADGRAHRAPEGTAQAAGKNLITNRLAEPAEKLTELNCRKQT